MNSLSTAALLGKEYKLYIYRKKVATTWEKQEKESRVHSTKNI